MVNVEFRLVVREFSLNISRWQQCFLAGIHHMLLGFRNNYGIVEVLQPLAVKDIEIRAVDERIVRMSK